jgi:hypothetical protein
VEGLEHIVRHFLGDVPLDEDNVSRIVARLGSTPQGEAPNVDEPFDVQFVSKNIARELIHHRNYVVLMNDRLLG